MPGRRTQNLIRALIGAALCVALVACSVVTVPEDPPVVAFGQAGLYRLEVALLVFYGSLLLITPAISGVIRGRLPIEISTRGAKFAEGADYSAELDRAAIKQLEMNLKELRYKLGEATIAIDQLEGRVTRRDGR